MIRTLLLLSGLMALSACASGGRSPIELIEHAQKETAIQAEAREYSRFSIARYASLTEDPGTAADGYAYVSKRVPEDVVIAERAVFSALLVGDFQQAAVSSKRLPPETLGQTELPRITVAVDALATSGARADLAILGGTWQRTFHAMLARSLLGWAGLNGDPDSAMALQEQAGGSDRILSGVGETLAALMKISRGDDAGAMIDLADLWQDGSKLAIGVEAEARLLAGAGQTDKARQRLLDFRREIGRNPALTALAREIDSGTVAPPKKLTVREGAALAIYASTAALAVDAENDLPAVYFSLALRLDPSLDAAKTLWADALDRANRRPEAMTLLVSIPPSSAFHTSAQGQLAWALRREGRNQEALDLARDTLEKTDDRNIQIQLADLLISLGRDGEAETILTEVIDTDETLGTYDWRLFFARGAARERLGYWPPAENDLRTALGLQPNDPGILNYLGYAQIDRGVNLEDGLNLIEKALRLDPMNGAITDSLGWAHYKLRNYDRAVFYLERAVELAPQAAEILDHLGDAYWQVGRYTEAGYQWQRALQYTRDETDREKLEAKLAGSRSLLAAASGMP